MFRSKSLKVSYEKYTDDNGNKQYNLDNPIPVKVILETSIMRQHINIINNGDNIFS